MAAQDNPQTHGLSGSEEAAQDNSQTQGLRGSEEQAKTRILLILWDMGAASAEVQKGDLTERITRTHEKAGDYQGVFDQLQQAEAIAISNNNKISLSEKGVHMLGEKLKSPEFQFDSQIGARTANALLKWIREMGTLDGASDPQ